MTPDDLEVLILEAKSAWELQKALENLDEKERAKLSSPSQKIFNQLYKSKANESASARLKMFIGNRKGEVWNNWNATETRRATLALFGLCQISAVKKREVHIWQDEMPIFERIIRDRRPDWLNDWIEHALEPESSHLDFAVLRGWIRDGVCKKPVGDGYFRMYAWHLMRTGFYHRNASVPPISVQLLADPDLLEDIEGLFRVENIAFNTNSWLQKGASTDYETWTEALLKLSAKGHVDRAKLLSLALNGLTLDLKQNQLSGFHGFCRQMSPTTVEHLRHQQDYIALLCHPVGHVVKFAIDMLSEIEKQGALDLQTVLVEMQTVFLSEGKGNAVAALKLIKKIIARQKPMLESALDAACEALRHIHADVQANALDILEANKSQLNGSQFETLATLVSFVSASNRNRLTALVTAGPASAVANNAVEGIVSARPKTADAAANVQDYVTVSDYINELSVLSPDNKLAAIDSVDELIDAVFHAVEIVDSPDDVERIIDGISRLAGQRPSDFEARIAPLRHRIEKGRTGQNSMLIGQSGVGLPLLDLLYTWMTGTLYRTPKQQDQYSQYYENVSAFVPMAQHLCGIAERVALKREHVLLSAPTHKGGWIDPLVWIERLNGAQSKDTLLSDMDYIFSVLRLAPDGRAEAHANAMSLPMHLRRVTLFALGGDETPVRADRKHYAAWIAAARCRSPHKDWFAEFTVMDIDDSWPDGVRPAQYNWRSSHKKGQFENQTWKTPEFDVDVTCATGKLPPQGSGGLFSRVQQALGGRISTKWEVLPTAAANRRIEKKYYWSGELSTPWLSQWLAYTWPQKPAASHFRGATKLMQRLDDNSSNWSPSYGYFQALFQRNRPWGEAGHLLLCLGLVGKDADAKGLAVDALIDGIEGHTFDPDMFASTMARLVEGEWIKFGRLADGLMPAVQVSERHAFVVGDALQKWLPLLDLEQRNAFRILEVLVEARAAAASPMQEATLGKLRKVTGSGKAAKLAKLLLSQ